MTEIEAKEIARIREIASKCNVELGRMWRATRKGPKAIHGRQLKFEYKDINDKNDILVFVKAVKKEFNYTSEIRNFKGRSYFQYVDFKLV